MALTDQLMRVLRLVRPSTLVFTYTLILTDTEDDPLEERDKMNGGLLQLDIPGWEFSDVATSLGAVTIGGDAGIDDLISGTTGDPVQVQLPANFGEAAGTHTLTITLTNIIVPIP